MTITEVSQKFHITPETLRYYERIGLLPVIGKDERGRRSYTEKDADWVYYVMALRRAGVSIDSIQEYIRLFYLGDCTREKRRQILLEERDRLARRIRDMEETLSYLTRKISNYDEYIRQFEEEKLEK